MKTHYSGRQSGEDEEQAACGTWLGESSNLTGDWSRVDCQHCIKQKGKISSSIATEEEAIVQHMGDMANFMREQRLDPQQVET